MNATTTMERTSPTTTTNGHEALEVHSSFEAAGLYAHGVRPDGTRREPDGHCTFLYTNVPTDLVRALQRDELRLSVIQFESSYKNILRLVHATPRA